MSASYYGYKEIVQALLDKGADINAKGNNGATALMNASINDHR
jgi:ankyrin repeat protein